jgi:hypothetical protein
MLNQNLKPFATALLCTLKEAGVSLVVVEFDGSGDSGSITGVEIEGGTPPLEAQWLFSSSSWVNEEWVTTEEVKSLPLNEVLEAWCYDSLEESQIDWYNNDGGFGELRIDLVEGEVKLEVNQRYTEISTYHFGMDGEESN